MLTVAIPKRNKLQNIIVLTPKDGNSPLGPENERLLKKACISGKSMIPVFRS